MIEVDAPLRKRNAWDHYPTPQELADRAVLDLLPEAPTMRPLVLDPGAGTGVWGRAVTYRWAQASVYGVELDGRHGHSGVYDDWFTRDYLDSELFKGWPGFDMIVGNPPYMLAEAFIRRSLPLLNERGQLLFLLRLGFLAGQGRARGLWKQYPPTKIHVCAGRPSYTGDGKTDATEYALFHWDTTAEPAPPQMFWWDWKAAPDSGQLSLFEATE